MGLSLRYSLVNVMLEVIMIACAMTLLVLRCVIESDRLGV